MVPNPIYEGEEDYETIDDCQKDYRDVKLVQLSTVASIKDNTTSLKDGKQPLPFPSESTPANVLMVDCGSGTGPRTLYLVDPDYYTAMNSTRAQSSTATPNNVQDPNGGAKCSD